MQAPSNSFHSKEDDRGTEADQAQEGAPPHLPRNGSHLARGWLPSVRARHDQLAWAERQGPDADHLPDWRRTGDDSGPVCDRSDRPPVNALVRKGFRFTRDLALICICVAVCITGLAVAFVGTLAILART